MNIYISSLYINLGIESGVVVAWSGGRGGDSISDGDSSDDGGGESMPGWIYIYIYIYIYIINEYT